MGIFDRFRKKRKVFVIGLDCAAPELIFYRWKNDLPNLSHLMDNGLWGELESSIPAITVPAWSSMLSSRDPGVLGIYGFRNRADHSYDKMTIAMGNSVKEKRVWNYLSEADLNNIVIGVPQTYPIRPIKGHLISGFLTPNTKSDFTYPFSFRKEVLSVLPDYDFDVKDFRTDDKGWLLKQIYTMTDKHFAVVDYALQNKPWDFFMYMEIGVDRIHHGFWHCHDPEHFRYQPGNPYENAIHDYYVYMDKKIGDWLDYLDDKTSVIVVSDHGAKRMDGGICINEWLWRNGYIAFKKDPTPGEISSVEKMEIDWGKTRAWGSGGYYGRLFLNVKGREPEGVIPQSGYENVRDELSSQLTSISDPNGINIGTRVFKPQKIYQQVNKIAPDLIIYFGDLYWRSVGSLGYDGWHTFENDTGPDSCNHAQNGMFILYDTQLRERNLQVQGAQLMDIAPTILNLFNLPIPKDMQGNIVTDRISR